MEDQPTIITRKRVIVFLLIVVSVFGLRFVSNSAVLKININNPSSGPVNYVFTNQKTHKSTVTTATGSQLSKRLPKGAYQIRLDQQGANHFEVIDLKGFFHSTQISANLQTEKQRLFVGDNPAGCFDLVSGVLVSFNCGDSFSNVYVHFPATSSLPTYTEQLAARQSGNIEGIAHLAGRTYILLKAPPTEDREPAHILYQFGGKSVLEDARLLKSLSKSDTYIMQSFGSGLVVFNSDASQLSFVNNSAPIKLGKSMAPDNKQMHFVSLNSNPQTGQLVLLYNDVAVNAKRGNSEVVVGSLTTGTVNHYAFPRAVLNSAVTCGSQKLCVLNKGDMEVYDISGSQPQKLYKVVDVRQLDSTLNGLLVVQASDVLSFNADNRSGYSQYHFGLYSFNDLRDLGGSTYILSLTGPHGKKVALLINTARDNSDSIDQKVAQLSTNGDVDSLSINGHFIYIAPNLGKQTFNSALSGSSYDSQALASTKAAITQSIGQLGIDTQTYKVIYTAR